jgi:hypothetical protein
LARDEVLWVEGFVYLIHWGLMNLLSL